MNALGKIKTSFLFRRH